MGMVRMAVTAAMKIDFGYAESRSNHSKAAIIASVRDMALPCRTEKNAGMAFYKHKKPQKGLFMQKDKALVLRMACRACAGSEGLFLFRTAFGNGIVAAKAGIGDMVFAKLDIPVVHYLEIATLCKLILGIMASDSAAFEFGRDAGNFMMAPRALRFRIDCKGGEMGYELRMAHRAVCGSVDVMVEQDRLFRELHGNRACRNIGKFCRICRNDHSETDERCTAQREQHFHKIKPPLQEQKETIL